MGGNERLAALKRARERQRRIEPATARAIRAQAAVERAAKARDASAHKHNEKVNATEQAVASAAADLRRICGSSEAAAEILGWSTRELRRITKTIVAPAPVQARTPAPTGERDD